MTRLLKIPEVMDRLAISRSTVHLMMKDGRLPVRRIGRAVRVPSEAVEKLTCAEAAED
ncbi:MAG: helix-turn-helix domain-containing protein [Gemmatimonadales bacterium]